MTRKVPCSPTGIEGSPALQAGPGAIRINSIYRGITDIPMFYRLGDEARFVTGQSVMVDGGFTLASM